MSSATDLEHGRRVITEEAKALQLLADSLGDEFANALEAILNLKGRLIVTGMGKSGHVGNKIAATLASTGQPSFFVHPGEASHGDLGMIGRDDGLLALSNSGETSELSDVLAHAKRLGIPLITVTGRPQSTMSRMADHPLVLPNAPEACPNGLAPTSSTTMAMALGDALAVALMHRRMFAAEDFFKLHPGGRLGLKFITVGSLMHDGDDLPRVHSNDSLDQVLLEITSKTLGCTLVMEDDKCQGIITDGDLRRHLNPKLFEKFARDIMTTDPIWVHQDEPAARALGLMQERGITLVLVKDDGPEPIGLLHIHDCLRAGLG
ncbi:MAG: KpsF/GutQ family sugar-phosphate isomerase [SAR116 cluster bacterium]|nr:MAG: KpsF/GutQ family sugar-phosphate isomerase [SAR116 cluster bacterium]HBQ23126.1 KpsF/GutQ family sugar-phosphate isomerase [Alphaproteobacteria bacterium]|tara:strand:- start:332 stop:1291 length:960 start_codon:yes stop_codon:yes gene_type:complete